MANRKTSYNDNWNKTYSWISPVEKDKYSANCVLCKKSFSISGRGESAVKDHADTEIHKKNERAAVISKKVTSFFSRE